jgi:outer membrane protein assembly factor BamB
MTGNLKWQFDMKGQGFDGNHFSPIATDGLIYCVAGCYIYAIDMKTGQRVWEYGHEARVNCVTIDNGVLYLACENGSLYALS